MKCIWDKILFISNESKENEESSYGGEIDVIK